MSRTALEYCTKFIDPKPLTWHYLQPPGEDRVCVVVCVNRHVTILREYHVDDKAWVTPKFDCPDCNYSAYIRLEEA